MNYTDAYRQVDTIDSKRANYWQSIAVSLMAQRLSEAEGINESEARARITELMPRFEQRMRNLMQEGW
jgi:hypothetical protein